MSAPPATVPTTRDWVGRAAVLAVIFMGQADGFVVTVAAPSPQRDLPATFGQVQFTGAAYVLAAAAGLVTGGRLGDRFDRRRVFLAGVAVFTLASLVCGVATAHSAPPFNPFGRRHAKSRTNPSVILFRRFSSGC